MKIIDFWSFKTPPRKTQLEAFDWLEQHEDKKFLFVEMPVGGGKSNMGITYARYLHQPNGNSFILTPQRILQAQYEQTFPKEILASLYGKNNYDCKPKHTTCDIGGLLTKPRCDNCPYERAKARVKTIPNAVFNYTYAMLAFGYTKVFDTRSLMILDECHNLEDHLTEFDAITIVEYKAKKFGADWVKSKTFEGVFKWLLDEYMPAAQDHLEQLQQLNEPLLDKAGSDLTHAELKRLKEMNTLEDHLDTIQEFSFQSLDALQLQYVLVQDKLSVKFKRLTGAYTFKRTLEPKADRFLFMSSTILNYEAYCKDIGIDPKQAAFISLDSEFPVDNRPVYYMPKMKMNAAWVSPENEQPRQLMLDGVNEILQMHEKESGIIHTANFQIAKWLVENLTDIPHQILHHNPDSGDKRNDIIEAFQIGKKPKILISPSITEGLDFKDDLSRFAIIVKLAFPYIGDQWIKRRLELSKEWYMRRTLIDLIQAGGRIVRTSADWGHVYILDSSFDYLFYETKHMIPKWWVDALKRKIE